MREATFSKYVPLRKSLVSDGWLTPNTYGNEFAHIENISAVYLFMLSRAFDFDEALVAYVGMSTKLQQRISSHNILPLIDKPGFWVTRWFKPVPRADLRPTEARYIAQFNPPWNTIGRPRGVLLN